MLHKEVALMQYLILLEYLGTLGYTLARADAHVTIQKKLAMPILIGLS